MSPGLQNADAEHCGNQACADNVIKAHKRFSRHPGVRTAGFDRIRDGEIQVGIG
jgi:hypothetical protein